MTSTDSSKSIKVILEPEVYLLGRQMVDPGELDRFLADHGVSWETDTELAGEHLTEIAGRVCYMSLPSPGLAATKHIWSIYCKWAMVPFWSVLPGTLFLLALVAALPMN